MASLFWKIRGGNAGNSSETCRTNFSEELLAGDRLLAEPVPKQAVALEKLRSSPSPLLYDEKFFGIHQYL